MKAKYQSGTSCCIEISDSASRTCMTVADAVRLKEELTKAIDDAEKDKREELTEFESGLFSAFSDGWQQYLGGEEVNVVEWAKEHSTELLAIAEREIVNRVTKECYKEDLCIEDTVKFNEGYKLGKEVALKDLPRWKKCGPDTGQIILYKGFCRGQNYLNVGGYKIMLSDLEKLPGFKEDESHE